MQQRAQHQLPPGQQQQPQQGQAERRDLPAPVSGSSLQQVSICCSCAVHCGAQCIVGLRVLSVVRTYGLPCACCCMHHSLRLQA
jgi:hypothetical protein